MQDQGKRLLLAVALALGVMLVWNMVFAPKKKDEPAPTAGSGSGSAIAVVGAPVAPPSPLEPSPPAEQPAAAGMVEAPRGPEQRIELAFPKFTATFSSYGGALVSWQLSDPRYLRDQTKGELLPGTEGTGAFLVDFSKTSTYRLPARAEWKGEKVSDTEVRFKISTDRLDVEKVFTLIPDAFLVKLVVTAKVKVPAGEVASETLGVTAFAIQDPAKADHGSSSQSLARAWVSSTLVDGSIHQTPIKDVIAWPRFEPNIQWSGFEHPYLLAAYAPKPAAAAEYTVEKHTFAVDPATGLMRNDLLYVPTLAFKSGDPAITRELVAYLGPKNYSSLEHADAAAGFKTGFKQTIDLGWFSFIGKPLLWLLQKFFAFFGNWGVAIILLTLLVKAATLYWTTKSMRSMKAMAALAPQMKGLQEKYKGDRQRLQAETMALYKTHNVNPIAGCLPILMQMPIWLALYRMLSSAGELYQQPFIHGWIDDLTAPDPFHVLPVILVVTMFAQARLTPQTGDSRQQKLIQYGMPLMFGVMSFFFPAGLTLYIFTNTCLSALHSIYMNKFDAKSLEIAALLKKNQEAAAAEATKAKGAPAKPVAKTRPVIDAESTEDNDDDATDSTADAAGPGPSTGPRPPRKRKKRRR